MTDPASRDQATTRMSYTTITQTTTGAGEWFMLAIRDMTLDPDEEGEVFLLTVDDLRELADQVNKAIALATR